MITRRLSIARRLPVVCLAALVFFGCSRLAAAEPPSRKIDRSLTESLRSGARTQRVIITVAPGH
ncbi:MAG: hypothetical protein ACREMY_32895, partial [bacterium]